MCPGAGVQGIWLCCGTLCDLSWCRCLGGWPYGNGVGINSTELVFFNIFVLCQKQCIWGGGGGACIFVFASCKQGWGGNVLFHTVLKLGEALVMCCCHIVKDG